MRKISNAMRATIDNTFYNSGTFNKYQSCSSSNSFDNNNHFTHFFRVKLTGDKFEIPIYAKSRIIEFYKNNIDTPKDLIMPFYNADDIVVSANGNYLKYKTVDSLIRSITRHIPSKYSYYTTGISSKDEIYYGSNGVIFNKDMKPLLFNVLEAYKSNSKTIVYTKAKSYIHPSVFTSDGTVEKCILNKIIPQYLQEGVYININSRVEEDKVCIDANRHIVRTIPEIVVKDISGVFICEPVTPRATFSNEEVNNMLINNIDTIIETMNN